MATVTIPDQTLARLREAAAARHVSLEAYLDSLAASDAGTRNAGNDAARRVGAVESIRKIAAEVKNKSTIEELIADKHAGHKY